MPQVCAGQQNRPFSDEDGLSCLQGKCFDGAVADARTALDASALINDGDTVSDHDGTDRASTLTSAAADAGIVYLNGHILAPPLFELLR